MRQYDPKMQLTIDREDYLYVMTNDYTDEMLKDEEHPQYRLLAELIKLQDVNADAFVDALEATKTEYVVVIKDHPRIGYLEEAGLKKVAETAEHVIYKYDVKEPYVFELVDYSVVY